MQHFVWLSFILFNYVVGFSLKFSVRDNVKITFIYGNYQAKAYSIENFPTILNHPNFDRQKTTTIYSYGFTETLNSPSVREVVDAYLFNGNFNFMVISCDNILAYNVFNADEITENIAESLLKVFEAGYGKFHLVGFSLGGQISGMIGRKLIEKSNNRFIIPRITGLDPGQIPQFFNIPIAYLNAGDAMFVDTIHGETVSFGSAMSTGNSSFWVNGGRNQPMCKSKIELITSICSHLLTPKFWTESVRSRTPIFKSILCDSREDFQARNCDYSITNTMGLYTNLNLNGKFYLETGFYPPYSTVVFYKGARGQKPSCDLIKPMHKTGSSNLPLQPGEIS